jgi:hypothetical protein
MMRGGGRDLILIMEKDNKRVDCGGRSDRRSLIYKINLYKTKPQHCLIHYDLL